MLLENPGAVKSGSMTYRSHFLKLALLRLIFSPTDQDFLPCSFLLPFFYYE